MIRLLFIFAFLISTAYSQTIGVLRIPLSEVDSIRGSYGDYSEIDPIDIGGGYYIVPVRCRYDSDLRDSWAKYDSLEGTRYTWDGSFTEYSDTGYLTEFEITYNDTIFPHFIDSFSVGSSAAIKYFTGNDWNIDSSYLAVNGSNDLPTKTQNILLFNQDLTVIDTFTLPQDITYVAQGITWNTDSGYYVITGTRYWYPAGDPVNIQDGSTGYTLYGTMVAISPDGNFIDTLQHPYDPYGSQYAQTGMVHYNPVHKKYLWSSSLYPLYLNQGFTRITDLVGYMKDKNGGDMANGEGITEHWLYGDYWGTGVHLGRQRLVKNDSSLSYVLDTVVFQNGSEDLCVNHSDYTIFVCKDKVPNNFIQHLNPNGTYKRILNMYGMRGFRCKKYNCVYDNERFHIVNGKNTGAVITPVIDFMGYSLQQNSSNIRLNYSKCNVVLEYRGSDTPPTTSKFSRLHLDIYDSNKENEGWGSTTPSGWQLTPVTNRYVQIKITLIK